ncbi:rhodoquinone biosynthesis methyltransferase RquA [Terasakiella sp. A23]|uniref:rhodoquinone biosynthesis methyltransferase RquA n=1 Tax=Terasakiella sp. FCG-A23 TaxID=3080561 RepID=UPI00295414B3|nr:rhodoquinone biosynthesis methyltransferase RquA [Terasakiella sp. A23]MDV7340784.1 rhodoquinone biosynthesis methyltransferase RquA [Terasakiella sp. A23]
MTYIRKEDGSPSSVSLPDYLQKTYTWAYLNPKTVPLLSSAPVVAAILWGNANRLILMTTAEIIPGQRVLQAAAVYGRFSTDLAKAVGPTGKLDVIDVAPIQVETARKRVEGFDQASVRLGDASVVQTNPYDTVICFFLLHEVPEEMKGKIVNALLASVKPGGKIVFVDYHKPVCHHPLKPIMSKVFDWLEPFAKGLWQKEIRDYAIDANQWSWSKETIFGGLYQKVVVTNTKDRMV